MRGGGGDPAFGRMILGPSFLAAPFCFSWAEPGVTASDNKASAALVARIELAKCPLIGSPSLFVKISASGAAIRGFAPTRENIRARVIPKSLAYLPAAG